MTEELKDLIEKIQEEGVKAAEDKAKDIEDQARREAKGIIENARKDGEDILARAKEEIAKIEKAHKEALKQSGRNLIIALKKEINSVLKRIITLRVAESLKPNELSKILASLIKNFSEKERADILVLLKKEDLSKLEKTFYNELKGEIKKKVTLKSAEDINGGFIISYDGGKSHFDFTDKALAEYISAYLNPKLQELLKEAGKE